MCDIPSLPESIVRRAERRCVGCVMLSLLSDPSDQMRTGGNQVLLYVTDALSPQQMIVSVREPYFYGIRVVPRHFVVPVEFFHWDFLFPAPLAFII